MHGEFSETTYVPALTRAMAVAGGMIIFLSSRPIAGDTLAMLRTSRQGRQEAPARWVAAGASGWVYRSRSLRETSGMSPGGQSLPSASSRRRARLKYLGEKSAEAGLDENTRCRPGLLPSASANGPHPVRTCILPATSALDFGGSH